MHNGSLLFSMLVAAAAWAVPASALAAEPPFSLVSPSTTLDGSDGASINGWALLASGGWTLKGSDAELRVVWNDTQSCTVAAGSGARDLTRQSCAALFAVDGTTQVTVFAGDTPTKVSVEWPVQPDCIRYAKTGASFEVVQQPCDQVDARGRYLISDDGKSWDLHSDHAKTLPDPVASAVKHALEQESQTYVLAWIGTELTRLGLKPTKATPDDDEPTRLTDDEKRQALATAGLTELCGGLLEPVSRPSESESKVRKRRNKAVRKEWHYVMCVDATDPNLVKPARYTTEPGADPDFVDHGNHLFEGRQLEVHVLHGDDHVVTIDLTGTAGTVNHVYVGESIAHTARARTVKVTSKPFAGRATDQTAQLSVTVTPVGSKTELASFQALFNVTAVYRAAIRFGLAGLVSPFEREYSARAATDAANNPGKVITLDAGGSSPLIHTELVTAMSVFFTPVYQGERTVTGGALFGLGILATGSDSGFDALTSVHVGLELDVGRDFSIAAILAMRRTKVLADGYFVGRAVADDETFTRLGFRPSFGLMLTWSPAFTKAFGTARKAK